MDTEFITNGAARLGDAIDRGKAFESTENLAKNKEQELVGGVLDIFYGASDGKLWEGGATFSLNLAPSETPNMKMGNFFKEGTTVVFVPAITNDLEDDSADMQKTGVFIFSQSGNPGNIAAVYSTSCYFTNEGHTRIKGAGRYMLQWDEQPKKESLLAGISLFGAGVVNDLIWPKK